MEKSRKNPRALVTLTARYRSPTAFEYVHEECYDLSTGGMFIKSPRPAPAGTLLKLECDVDDPGRGRQVLRGVARVVWQRDQEDGRGQPVGMGVKFVKLDPGARELIEAILEHVGTSDPAGASRRVQSDAPSPPSLPARPPTPPPRTSGSVTLAEISVPIMPRGRPSEPAPAAQAEPQVDSAGTSFGDALIDHLKSTRPTNPEFASVPPVTHEPERQPSNGRAIPVGARTLISHGGAARTAETEGRSRATPPPPTPAAGEPAPAKARESSLSSPPIPPAVPQNENDPRWRAQRLRELIEANEGEETTSAETADELVQRPPLPAPAQRRPPPRPPVVVEMESDAQAGPAVDWKPFAVGGAVLVAVLVAVAVARNRSADEPTPEPMLVGAQPAPEAPQPPATTSRTPPTAPAAPTATPVEPPKTRAPDPEASAKPRKPEPKLKPSRPEPAPKPRQRERPADDPEPEPRVEAAPAVPPVAPKPPPPAPEAPPQPDDEVASAEQTPMQAAMDCLGRGDNRCVVTALEGKAQSARELELLIETYRTLGEIPKAQTLMERYVKSFPNERRTNTYNRVLELQEGESPDSPASP